MMLLQKESGWLLTSNQPLTVLLDCWDHLTNWNASLSEVDYDGGNVMEFPLILRFMPSPQEASKIAKLTTR